MAFLCDEESVPTEAKHVLPVTAEPKRAPERIACPRCRESLLHLPIGAKFCPHCGAELPADCPAWLPAEPVPPLLPQRHSRLSRWMRLVFHAGMLPDENALARRP